MDRLAEYKARRNQLPQNSTHSWIRGKNAFSVDLDSPVGKTKTDVEALDDSQGKTSFFSIPGMKGKQDIFPLCQFAPTQ